MKHYNHFFGVDVSKKTIDITHADKQLFTHRQFCNEINLNFEETLFCMEATGLYCFPLTQFLATNSIDT
jgi:transposase